MLFGIKNHFWATLALLGICVFTGLRLETVLGLPWSWDFLPRDLLIGAAALIATDAGLHGLLALILGDRYWACYFALVDYFRPQRAPQIITGGLLAGGEELLFRGVLLEGLRSIAGWPAAAAVVVSAVVFGLLHLIPRRLLWPFALWAVWEGALLGIIYVWSGSLLAVLVLHVLHDIGGFTFFAYQRGRR